MTPILSDEAHVGWEKRKGGSDGVNSPSVAGTTQWLVEGHQPAGEGEGRGVCPAT